MGVGRREKFEMRGCWIVSFPDCIFLRSVKSSLGMKLGVGRVMRGLSLLSNVQLQGNLFGTVLADESVWTLGMHA